MILNLRPYTADGFIVNEILSQDCYLSALIKPDDVVVDIGAHIGCFTSLALTRTKYVYAFEPQSENFKLLQENAPKAILYNYAISFDETTENKRIKSDGFNTGGGTMNEVEGDKVECRRFDNTLELFDHIDFLKIDIEGSEAGLLQHPNWLDKVKILAIETHNNMFNGFYNMLFNAGFKFLKSYKNGELGLIVCIK